MGAYIHRMRTFMGFFNFECKNSRAGFVCNNNEYLAAINLGSPSIIVILGGMNTFLKAFS